MFSGIKKWFKEIKELKYYAYHDELTGLYNRHYLKTIDINKYNYVYFIDINNLKEYNKNGHTSGDQHILDCVGDIKDNYLSYTDCFIRYAGDEFIILSVYPRYITTNCLYSVGESKITFRLDYSINIADKKMIENKAKFKSTNPPINTYGKK